MCLWNSRRKLFSLSARVLVYSVWPKKDKLFFMSILWQKYDSNLFILKVGYDKEIDPKPLFTSSEARSIIGIGKNPKRFAGVFIHK